MNAELAPTLEKWGFIGLGLFTSCCYTNDFAPLDLLRFPQIFSAHVENRIAIFNLPNWLPQDHGILKVDTGQLYSKLGDLPLPKQTKATGDNQKTLAIQLPETLAEARAVTLTYWPLFRFAHTGQCFSINDSTAGFACRIMEYTARRANYLVSPIETSGTCSRLQIGTTSTKYYFVAEGTNDLRRFSLSDGEHQLGLDIENRILTLSEGLTPNLVKSINDMLHGRNSLKNCLVEKSHPSAIYLRHQGASNV